MNDTSTLPHIMLITTGGTIAGAAGSATEVSGYAVGGLGAEALLAAVPQVRDVARIEARQPFNIDSKDMTPDHWLTLATLVQAAADDPAIAGIVITHGTDTMEETATWLALVIDTDKPVVMTGAMRPATALSADGPMNLFDAVRCAAAPDSHHRGVLLCFGETILRGFGVRKQDTQRLDAFAGVHGAIGRTRPGLEFFSPAAPRRARLPRLDCGEALPRVEVIQAGAGTPPDLMRMAADHGAAGIVIALPGNGGVAETWTDAITEVVRRGIPVVRASRCGEGDVSPSDFDRHYGSLAAGVLSAAAARVVLTGALAARQTQPGFDLNAFFIAASRAAA